MKSMPTIKELMSEIEANKLSVAYNQSRTVLNNLNKPVVAYGIGLFGFICVYQDKNQFLKGVYYSMKNGLSKYKDGNFNVLPPMEALKIIITNKLIARKEINENEIKDGKVKDKRPILGTFEYTYLENPPYYSTNKTPKEKTDKYTIQQYKNKKFLIYEIRDYGFYEWKNKTNLKKFFQTYYSIMQHGVKDKNNEPEKIISHKINIPEKILKEMKLRTLANEI